MHGYASSAPEPVLGIAGLIKSWQRHWMLMTAALLGATVVVLHWRAFGSPTTGLDEQFYLLTGDRMWRGAVPYVDIWDRKPAGLFLIYAAIRLLPGDGVVAYQIVASLSLIATGCVVARIARRTLPAPAAIAAGLATVIYGVVLGEGFGEAPIFYDLLVALAAASVLRVRDRAHARTVDRHALLAMLLCGTALTIKTTAVFESIALGLLLLNADRGSPLLRRLTRAAAYVVLGLLPTVLIGAFYAWRGGFEAFWFANFRSIFLRGGGADADSLAALIAVALILVPLILPALVEARRVLRPDRTVLIVWALAAAIGFVSIGYFHFHYALPMVAPLAILAAHALRRTIAATIALLALVGLVSSGLARPPGDATRDRAEVEALVATLPPAVHTQCLLVYEGPTILYHASNACLPGSTVFPGHYTSSAESHALPRSAEVILHDALARRPAAITWAPSSREIGQQTSNDHILRSALIHDYRLVATRPVRLYGMRMIAVEVWWRRDLTAARHSGVVRKISKLRA